ncbi:MAG: nitric oxide reductase transcriptional regulator NorR [Acidobacteria bacterium]|nr:nitric oxide reductase transcriptional regulator NorR [Acidobacteriota bacterium]
MEALIDIAKDLTASLAAEDRYARLLAAVTRLIPCDAACLLRLEDGYLVPLAGRGLVQEALVRRFSRREQPRLDVILNSPEPVLFPADSQLSDPFDGLLISDPGGSQKVHACLGCRLVQGERVVGALTADALAPHAFDALDMQVVAALGALAGAAIHTTLLIEALERTAERRGQVARELVRNASGAERGLIIGNSSSIRRLMEEIQVVARSDLPVLITGETGSGKELIARHIHSSSARNQEALIQVNCAALPESIAESELFGHVAGAFTGAMRDRAGKFEIAHGGTLFLDEIGELPMTIQPKLLRVLQYGEIQRVGSDRSIRVDVRLIAATNRDLKAEIEAGRFRVDLYHRLAVYPIHAPALRERREDIPLIAAHILESWRQRLGLGPLRLSDDARERLVATEWPGNVRELENVISRGVLRASQRAGERGVGVLVEVRDLDLPQVITVEQAGMAETEPAEAPRQTLADSVMAFQRRRISDAVARNHGNWAAAARELGLHRSNLHHLATRLGLRPASRKALRHR